MLSKVADFLDTFPEKAIPFLLTILIVLMIPLVYIAEVAEAETKDNKKLHIPVRLILQDNATHWSVTDGKRTIYFDGVLRVKMDGSSPSSDGKGVKNNDEVLRHLEIMLRKK